MCLLTAASVAACGTDALSGIETLDGSNPGGDSDGGIGVDPQPDVSDAGPGTLPSPDLKVAALITSCGDGTLRSNAPMMREPYVQQVTTTSAVIGWGAIDGSQQQVEVTTPAGQPVMTVPSVAETMAVPLAGMQLRWTTLDGLQPDSVYCYTVGTSSGAFAARAGFRTAPAAEVDRTLRFVAIGDSGTGSSSQRAIFEQLRVLPQELIIHVGDVAYFSGTASEFQTRVFDVYASLLKYVPMFAVAGNHEYVTADAAPFRDAFALPNNERWYSFDWGNVHFAGIDSQQNVATQVAWLDADLAATDKPWKIVFSHEPPYSSGDHGSSLNWRAALAPVLERHGVQLVLSGHDHDYERTTPQNGVTYVVTGGGGGNLRPVGTSEFTAYSASVLNFVALEVTRDQLTVHAIGADGVEFDGVTIPRE